MNKMSGTVSHQDAELAELRADKELALAYLKAAMESLDNPNDRAAGLLAGGGLSAAKLFLLKPEDEGGLSALQALYPNGLLRYHQSRVPGKEFMSFFVPSQTAP